VIESTLLLWGFALLGAALLLLVIELFVPSGGIIGVAALAVAIAGVVLFWRVSVIWGVTSTALVLILTPIAINFGLKIMPHTPMGKHLFLDDDAETTEARQARHEAQREQELALVGAVGTARTDLHPIGTAEIEGTRIEVLAEGGAIDAGTPVRVTRIEANQVRVRAI